MDQSVSLRVKHIRETFQRQRREMRVLMAAAKRMGWTRAEIARARGKSISTVSNWYRGAAGGSVDDRNFVRNLPPKEAAV